jgi:steroid 5-alpha reductase family enzyme
VTPLAQLLLENAGLIFAAMIGLWAIATVRRDVSLVDVFWGPGFALVTWHSIWQGGHWNRSVALLAVPVTVWAVRLAVHIALRNRGHAEDRRYQAMRKHHGRRFWWISLFTVFLLQGTLMWWISLPLQIAGFRGTDQPGALAVVGVVLWLTGFLWEALADWQLTRFRSDPRNHGRVLDQGLWRYSRHPNYFGECVLWWGFWMLSASQSGWWTILSPLTMTFLLLKVSGVTLLESTMTDRRPEYADYQRRTNAFWPGPPRLASRS